MRKCKECGHVNLEGTLVCNDCGYPLLNASYLDSTLDLPITAPYLGANSGTSILSDVSEVVLELVGFSDVITVAPNQRTTLGRSDSSSGNVVDIDLTPFGAFEKGVSRTHAAIIRQESSLTLLDLGSSNGTLINGRRIAANQPRVIQDGDEITFGQLAARIHFK